MKRKKDIPARVEYLKALDIIARSINDEEQFHGAGWLENGVPDEASETDLESIAEDDEMFASVMNAFVILMTMTDEDDTEGTLYFDGVINRP